MLQGAIRSSNNPPKQNNESLYNTLNAHFQLKLVSFI